MFRHKLNKLVDFNDPWPILIYFFQYFLDMFISIVISQGIHEWLEFSLVDATRVIAVEDLKGLTEDFDLLLREGFLFLFVLLLLWLTNYRPWCLRLLLICHWLLHWLSKIAWCATVKFWLCGERKVLHNDLLVWIS
jgi:hypothetical protein